MPFAKYLSKVSAEIFDLLRTDVTLSHQLIQMSRQVNVLMIISANFYDHSDKDTPDLSAR